VYGVTPVSPLYLFRLESNSQIVTFSTISAAVSTTGAWGAGEVDPASQLLLFSGSDHWAPVSLSAANICVVDRFGIATAPAGINDCIHRTVGGNAL
jgi:hypothetical protein